MLRSICSHSQWDFDRTATALVVDEHRVQRFRIVFFAFAAQGRIVWICAALAFRCGWSSIVNWLIENIRHTVIAHVVSLETVTVHVLRYRAADFDCDITSDLSEMTPCTIAETGTIVVHNSIA